MGFDKNQFFDYANFYDYVAEVMPDNASLLEIGCFVGGSTAYLCDRMQKLGKAYHMTVIDNFSFNGNEQELEFYKNVEPYFANITVLKGLSGDLHAQIPHQSLDFAFIDGCHAFQDVCDDIVNYWPKMKRGGLFSGHDYELTYMMEHNVKPAVHKYIPRHKLKIMKSANNLDCWYMFNDTYAVVGHLGINLNAGLLEDFLLGKPTTLLTVGCYDETFDDDFIESEYMRRAERFYQIKPWRQYTNPGTTRDARIYREKWGGNFGVEKYTKPFNGHNHG